MTKKTLFILFLILTLQLSTIPIGINLTDTAQARSKSSGNEVMRDIQSGLNLTGRTKSEVLKLIGPPWEKDMTPVKARYNEKWTYSCEKKNGLTYDCVFIYFGADRVKKVEIY
ncbi:MAG: hypothetical protein AAF438_09650 [Pseudomonadota bacterium]